MSTANQKLVLYGNRPLELETGVIPELPDEGLIIKVAYAGICHSDVHMKEDTEGDIIKCRLPFTPGHEISGHIHSIGKNCKPSDGETLEVGDRVLVYAWSGCLDCSFCDKDVYLCRGRLGPNDHLYGCALDGGFQQYCKIDRGDLVLKVPESIPLDLASLVCCSGLTAYNGVSGVVDRIKLVTECQGTATLLIIGAGGLGLWGIQLARAILPETTRIVVADLSEEKIKLALAAGADASVLWSTKDDPEEQIRKTKEACNGGADGCVDFVNLGSTVATTFGAANMGCNVSLVGLYKGKMPPLPLHLFALRGIVLRGIATGSYAQMRELIDLVTRKKLDFIPISYAKLEEVEDILAKLDKGQIEGRVVVKYG